MTDEKTRAAEIDKAVKASDAKKAADAAKAAADASIGEGTNEPLAAAT
jgi:hypothetical protein